MQVYYASSCLLLFYIAFFCFIFYVERYVELVAYKDMDFYVERYLWHIKTWTLFRLDFGFKINPWYFKIPNKHLTNDAMLRFVFSWFYLLVTFYFTKTLTNMKNLLTCKFHDFVSFITKYYNKELYIFGTMVTLGTSTKTMTKIPKNGQKIYGILDKKYRNYFSYS